MYKDCQKAPAACPVQWLANYLAKAWTKLKHFGEEQLRTNKLAQSNTALPLTIKIIIALLRSPVLLQHAKNVYKTDVHGKMATPHIANTRNVFYVHV